MAYTGIGALLAFPLGLIAGILAGYVIAFASSYQATINPLIPVLIGGLGGGAVVGALQAPLVRRPQRWIPLSALGGVAVLPSALGSMYLGTAANCADLLPAFAVLPPFSGLLYGLITFAEAPTLPVNGSG